MMIWHWKNKVMTKNWNHARGRPVWIDAIEPREADYFYRKAFLTCNTRMLVVTSGDGPDSTPNRNNIYFSCLWPLWALLPCFTHQASWSCQRLANLIDFASRWCAPFDFQLIRRKKNISSSTCSFLESKQLVSRASMLYDTTPPLGSRSDGINVSRKMFSVHFSHSCRG